MDSSYFFNFMGNNFRDWYNNFASGKITTVVPNVEVQSNYDSVVKDIYVKKGQSVKQGEPLVAFWFYSTKSW